MFRQILDGKLNIELVTSLAKKHSSNPSMNITAVISSCESNDIQTSNLKFCPQMAMFFHCLYATLYKSNVINIESTTNAEINLGTTLGYEFEVGHVEFVTNMTQTEETTTEVDLDGFSNALIKNYVDLLDTSDSVFEQAITVSSVDNSSVAANFTN